VVNAKIHRNTTLFPDLETKIRARIRPTRRKEYLSRNPKEEGISKQEPKLV